MPRTTLVKAGLLDEEQDEREHDPQIQNEDMLDSGDEAQSRESDQVSGDMSVSEGGSSRCDSLPTHSRVARFSACLRHTIAGNVVL